MRNAGLSRLLDLPIEAVLLAVKASRDERRGNQVPGRIAACFQVRADSPIHVGIAQRLQADAQQPLLAFGQVVKRRPVRAWLLSQL